MKSTRCLTIALFAINTALVIGSLQWLGCATPPPRNRYREPTAPGFYNVKGWNYQPVYYANQSSEGTAYGVDINGEVGHPFNVAGPTALAVPTHSWYAYYRVLSGSLPPGLTLDDVGGISGIPTQGGHWIVTIECYNMTTNGTSYLGFQQQVRLHINGGGKVVQ